ncbi:DDRGK domain-containing protein 1-like [Sycon ciliatum]|uniref:DDRGK domain-containing protein 1-like n=1 Tax=Sycon ciliatum TaxID=27933 RepID=UPI0031F5F685|eukprot:scpid41234/ scgid6768/ DDRGK domain-containing protein 1
MDEVLVLLVGAVFVVVAALFFVTRWQRKKEDNADKKEDGEETEEDVRPQRRTLTAQEKLQVAIRSRRANRGAADAVAAAARNNIDLDEEISDDEFMDPGTAGLGKIGAKKLKKLEKKAEAARVREQGARDREQKKEDELKREAARKKKEEEEKLEEERLAQEEEKRKEEKERKELEEYEKLKSLFSVEESGENAVNEEEEGNLLQKFISHIKEKKVVLLEDLAAHFDLKTQDAIARLKDLLASGEIEGLLDDRGKFIYISKDEYAAVSKYIVQNGRVSISDLAQAATKILKL